jgi:hypothetical protein
MLFNRVNGKSIRSLLFFSFFYLYLWLEVKLCFLSHGGGVIFNFPFYYKTYACFESFMQYPGGLARYISAFLSQSFYYSWAGAIVVTVQAWLFSVCINFLFQKTETPFLKSLRFAPALLMIVVYNQYTYYFDTFLSALVGLAFTCLYIMLKENVKSFRFIVFLILSMVTYMIAGGASVVLAWFCVFYEKNTKMKLLFLASALLIPCVFGFYIFGTSIQEAYLISTPFSLSLKTLPDMPHKIAQITAQAVYLIAPLSITVFDILSSLIGPKRDNHCSKQKKLHGNIILLCNNSIVKWSLNSLLLALLTTAVVIGSYNKKTKGLFATDYYAYYKNWPMVLESAGYYPEAHYTIHAVNEALYHTGRLGDDMFNYPQHQKSLFLGLTKLDCWKKFDFLIEIGMLNIAENALLDSLGSVGENPAVLRRLALVKMVKGDMPAAKVYLNALGKTLFCDDWANNYLNKIETDPNLENDKEIQYLRSIKTNKNEATLAFYGQNTLGDLVKENPHNKAAFEYYMALLMLTKQWAEFTDNIWRLRDFGYTELPRHYEEVLMLRGYQIKKYPDTFGYVLSEQAKQNFQDVCEILTRHNDNKESAFRDLMLSYGNSYYFYSIYSSSGLKK